MERLAVLSLHTSPLVQPGSGDGGGMNVYVRELSAALARSGVACEVFTRAVDPDVPAVVDVEPGFRVHHVPAGPVAPVAKEDLPGLVDEWTDAVGARLTALDDAGAPVEALHANYWLSGVAGHQLKHRFDLPLVSTFHTLDRVKAESSPEEVEAGEPQRRARAETEIVGCSDLLLASCSVEADQLVGLYGARRDRIELVPPGVEHAFFSPGERAQARRAVGWDAAARVVLFVGRIQPLKGLTVAVEAVGRLAAQPGHDRVVLAVLGGPSGPRGADELARARVAAEVAGITDRVWMLPPQPHEMLSSYYRASDVCVVPSRSESFGLVALEAAACGIPVVASAVGGLTTLVDHGRTGYLVDGDDPDRFASRLGALLAHPELAARTGVAAAHRAGRYTWPAAAARLRARCDALTARELVACR